jgi:fibronectin type 3 domain-containing protein
MNKRFSFFYAAMFMAVFTGALVCSACDPDANDPSVNFVIENLSSYDLYNVKLLNESFVTAGKDFLAKNTPSAGVRLLPETGRRITFARESGGGASELTVAAPIAISLRDNRFVIENSTIVAQDGGELCALSELITPPSDVTAEAVSSTSVRVKWSAVATGAVYIVSRSSGGGAYTQIGGGAITETSYDDTGLQPGSTYSYTVKAQSADGKRASGPSSPASATTKPAAPSSVFATAQSSSGITVSWSAVAGASSYFVYRADSDSGPYAQVGTVAETSYADTGLQSDATYYYKVAASNAGGASEQSASASATTKKAPLAAPGGITAAADSATSVRLSWNAVPNAASYKVYYGTAANAITTAHGTTSNTTYTVTGLSTWTPYYFAVSSVDSEGVEGATSTAEVAATPQDPDATLSARLSTLASSAQSGGTYTIEIARNESLAPTDLNYSGKTVTVILSGGGSEKTVSLSGTGCLFTVRSGVTLVLDANVTLKGHSSNTGSLIQVNTGGALAMKNGSKIAGNTANSGGGGVCVDGAFTMDGGTISGNTVPSGYVGGGVVIDPGGVFTMNGGTISGNMAGSGGGVGTGSSSGARTFIMNGGTINGNTATSTGGGIYIGSGTFTLKGGAISNNTAAFNGGGVLVDGGYSGSLTLSGGTISGNTASGDGNTVGGVYIHGGATFTMTSGTISGNRASSGGGVGGVDNTNGGRFVMSGGTISGNTTIASSQYYNYGGGVYLQSQYTFTKSGGIIYGSNGGSLSNTAGDGGAAVYLYISSTTKKIRNTTAGATVSLDSAKSGGAGGWE